MDRYAQVSVRGNKYSVPARLIGRQVRVLLNALNRHEFGGGSAIWFRPQRGPVSHRSRPRCDSPSGSPRTRQVERGRSRHASGDD
ncbi:Mu transposase domain-containing protein [Rhodococcus sp. (in: high G+C Gram-positive bacteria)]|uniref:Mu transposase domain-containing protein n=1 Tax=Rhodococcus sp. TaxID=1831 RepID=UPI003BB7BC39